MLRGARQRPESKDGDLILGRTIALRVLLDSPVLPQGKAEGPAALHVPPNAPRKASQRKELEDAGT